MLIEVIYRGLFSIVDFSFVKKILVDAREVYFTSPDVNSPIIFNSVVSIINSNDYVDLVINTDCLKIKNKIVPKVFINIGRNNEEIEVLLFFDSKDLKESNEKMNIDYIRNWTIEFHRQYNFEYYICQIDNADEGEYYFDSNGTGYLYNNLI
ncbi:hypothetical protein J2X97_002799 [Epilithonimonas hungarica]|uniref:hypothetical protein n=1 Tax=Epilithonimonas hungarica TaxID=454006 RepID=UPI00278776B0|nr:hypothetical protein [Epilithonimonas hungarica]MDP9957133.1 hypothetical protein [Epilithonimonas hungarica]